MALRVVEDGMGGVEPQAISVELVEPVLRVVEHEPANGCAVRAVVIDRLAPGRLIPIGEIVRAVCPQIVAVGTKVVVDDVEQHAQSKLMSGIDEAFEPVRATIRLGWRKQVDAVVAPVAAAWKFGHRQRLDRADAKCFQSRQLLDQTIKRTRWRRGPDVRLVDDQALDAYAAPGVVVPLERVRIDDLRWPMDAL